jgi:hypothetical protein
MDKTDNQNNIEEDQIFLTYDNKFLIEKEG